MAHSCLVPAQPLTSCATQHGIILARVKPCVTSIQANRSEDIQISPLRCLNLNIRDFKTFAPLRQKLRLYLVITFALLYGVLLILSETNHRSRTSTVVWNQLTLRVPVILRHWVSHSFPGRKMLRSRLSNDTPSSSISRARPGCIRGKSIFATRVYINPIFC